MKSLDLMKNRLNPAEKYLNYLEEFFFQKPEFYTKKSSQKSNSNVTSIVFNNLPEPNSITSFTYGLSTTKHREWKLGRPELTLTVNSTNNSWKTILGLIADELSGKSSFSYGSTINIGKKISDDSQMDAFLIFAPCIFQNYGDSKKHLNIDIGFSYKINIVGLYPIYSSEIKLIEKWGLKKFWHHPQFIWYDVNRNIIE